MSLSFSFQTIELIWKINQYQCDLSIFFKKDGHVIETYVAVQSYFKDAERHKLQPYAVFAFYEKEGMRWKKKIHTIFQNLTFVDFLEWLNNYKEENTIDSDETNPLELGGIEIRFKKIESHRWDNVYRTFPEANGCENLIKKISEECERI